MKTNHDTDAERYLLLEDAFREALITSGFMPLDLIHDDYEIGLAERDAKVLGYFEERGWDAFRIEPALADATFTLARWSEDGIEIMAINENGVDMGEARFHFNRQGVAWASAAVQA